MSNVEILTAEKVAHYLPFSGQTPTVQGRIINVTHQIPFNILKSHDLRPDAFLLSPPRSPPLPQPVDVQPTSDEPSQQDVAACTSPTSPIEKRDPVAAAPVSKLARHHQRGHTLRAKFHAADWTVVQRRGHAALYAGVQSLSKDYETIHIGWTGPIRVKGTKQPVRQIYQEDKVKLEKLLWHTDHIIPIFLDSKSHGHYEGYCKQVLWPLFHYIVGVTASDGRKEKKYWADYEAVNQQFADVIIENYREGDIICIHDYHLLLVPEMIRSKIPNAVIGLFFHATMPSSEILRCLTTRNIILQGMLGSTLIGFQTYSYARHFISSCTRVLGCESTQVGVNYNGHMVAVGAFPIGIDSDRVHTYCKQPGVQPKMAAIRDMYSDKKIVIGRDKLDSTKGVLQKLNAFEQLLERYPEWRNKVVLIQVATPTFGDHGKLETKISEAVSHINSTYGSLEFTPVHYFHQDVDRDEYYALLSVADVGLITCIRDGMNTTSFEFVVCQNERHSPLILSEFAGTAGSLSAAIHVNPWDYAGVAKALNDALNMPEEDKLTRHQQLYRHVTSHTASFWAHSFVNQLISVSEQQSLQSHATPALNIPTFLEEYRLAGKRLMFFDYDGTLTPIVSTPSEAKPSAELLTYLQTLCDNPRNSVWVVSGRDQATLEEWLGNVRGLGFSAEHGCYLRPPFSSDWTNIVDGVDMSWKNDVKEIFAYYTERTQGSFIEYKKSSITWHYRLADVEYGEFQAKECQNHLENAIVSKLPVEILVGKKNLEVRPMSINKGEIVKRILSQHMDVDMVICAGDDKTDEDMFRMLNSIHLASKFHRAKQNGSPTFAAQPCPPTDSSGSSPTSPTPTRTRRSPSVALSSAWSDMNMELFSITVDMINWPCSRLLNSTSTIGCSTRQTGSGVLFLVNSQVDIDSFVEMSLDDSFALVIPYPLLTMDNIANLEKTGRVTGLLATFGTAPITNANMHQSPDENNPNHAFGLYASDPNAYVWNPQGTALAHTNFPFPIFGVEPYDTNSTIIYNNIMTAAQQNQQRQYSQYPLQAVDFSAFMWAAMDSSTCLRRGWSDDQKPIVVLTAAMDSNSLFHDLTVGVGTALSGLVTLLTVADTLSKQPAIANGNKHVLYTAFAAEPWGFAGSKRFLQDITQPFVCTNGSRSTSCPYDNSPCSLPCVQNLDFKRINVNQIDTVIEFGSLGNGLQDTGLWAHVDDENLSGPLVQHLQSYNNQTNISLQPAYADGVHRRLPPSSAMSFLSHKSNIKAAVLTEYQSQLPR
ncbi:hypothetical protein DM01DRAFT_320421 [Hesseltinella vesiculosa]|uniref:Nicastrin small lobe domain-containing protein n=1 Tax=Hesseltinella vesiculosa TaxID=101127 RepID=A0A1X2GXD9_9FUNG|nr:hypothetical protein DM01DRAFT_320421 [Hesseltinella vesiculosa]